MTKELFIALLLSFGLIGCSGNNLVKRDIVVPTTLAGIDSKVSDFIDEGYVITSGPHGGKLDSNIWFEKKEYKIWAWFKNESCYHILYTRKRQERING